MCPLCNGFTNQILEVCPACSSSLMDYGPTSFLLSDYSPYRDIDDMKLNDGWQDLQNHQCPHQLYCPTCGYMKVTIISEQWE